MFPPRLPPGSRGGRGVAELLSKFSYFARLCCHIPTAGGSLILGFTPCPRPRVRGPAPHLLLRVGFLPGSFHGVGEKTASRAVSFLVLFCLLFSTVFAQALAAQHTHLEPRKFVCFCPFNSGNFGYLSCLCCTHPFEGENPKFTSSQVCARSLGRREWHLNCQLRSVANTVPSLPTFCYCFTDTSLSLPHSSLPRLSALTTKDLQNPFSASNLANLTHGSFPPPIPSLSASRCWSFYMTLPLGHHVEGSLPQILYLTSSEGGLCHPFSVLYLSHGCSTPISSLSARSGASLSLLDLVWESSPLPIRHLDLKNGDLCLPFSCSNFAFGRSRPSTLDLEPFS